MGLELLLAVRADGGDGFSVGRDLKVGSLGQEQEVLSVDLGKIFERGSTMEGREGRVQSVVELRARA
jgi:hypothetical protein